MLYEVLVLDKANGELVEALEWYTEQQNGLAHKFIKQFKRETELISNNPESFPVIRKGNRQIVMNKFPYVIIYSIDKKKQKINIVSIFHTSRNPNKKFRK